MIGAAAGSLPAHADAFPRADPPERVERAEPNMARKPNYDFERRKKEQERKAKKDAKAQRKLERGTDEEGTETPAGDAVEEAPAE
jgi:hypothetical protein